MTRKDPDSITIPGWAVKVFAAIGAVATTLIVAIILTGASTVRDHENRIVAMEVRMDNLIKGQGEIKALLLDTLRKPPEEKE